MLKLYSPEEIWQDFEEVENAEPTFCKIKEDENNVYYDVYFNGKKTASGITRIYGLFAYPKKMKCPVVLLAHDINSSVDESFVDYFLNLKYAVLMCDMYGDCDGRKHTFYPPELDYANRIANENCREVKDDPRITMQFEWTCVQRYAVNFIKSQSERVVADKICAVGIREGAEVVWRLATTTDLTCAMPLFYAGWQQYGKMTKSGHKVDDDTDSMASYVACLGPQSQAPYIKVPTLFMMPSNYVLGGLDRAFDTMARANGECYCPVYVAAGHVNSLDEEGTRNVKVWLDKYLKGNDTTLAERPLLSVERLSDKIAPKCIVDRKDEVERVRFFFSEGVADPTSRCYFEKELSPLGDGYISVIDLPPSKYEIHAFANVEYKNGFTITSNLVNCTLAEKVVDEEFTKDNLIYNSLLGKDTFKAIPNVEDNSAKGTFLERDDLSVRVCYGGIKGLSSDMNLSTFKLSHPKYSGDKGNILVFDIFSEEQSKIKVSVYAKIGENLQKFTCLVNTIGGKLWQNFRLDESDFKTSELIPLTSWKDVKLIMFSSESKSKYMINNILWL